MTPEVGVLIRGILAGMIVVGIGGVLIGPFALPGVVLLVLALIGQFVMKAMWSENE